MPKTISKSKKTTKSTAVKATPSKAVKKTVVKAPHMTKTIFGASYLLILAVLSLLLITITNQLLR